MDNNILNKIAIFPSSIEFTVTRTSQNKPEMLEARRTFEENVHFEEMPAALSWTSFFIFFGFLCFFFYFLFFLW